MTDKLQGKPLTHRKSGNETDQEHYLVLYNDDINSFDYVVDSLIEVCGHTSVQAEQCTYIAHHKGMCEVKKGGKKFLEPMQINLVKKGLKATIE